MISLKNRIFPIAFVIVAAFTAATLPVVANADPAASSAATADATSAIDQVRNTIDQVVKIVESLPGESNLSARRKQLRTLLDTRFDFEEMSKRSLGTYWKERTPAEQQEFVSLFSDLLAKTYLVRIEEVKSGMVRIKGENTDGTRATVKTSVQSKGDTFPIDYKLINQKGNWRVYDVVIENIGLVSNYRNEFAGIIRKDGFAGLIQRLKDKNAASQ